MDVTSYLLGKNAGGGSPQPALQSKEIEITENGKTNITADAGYDALSKVSITTNVSSGGDLDWSALGFGGEPTQVVNTKNQINSDYDYAKEIKDTWTPTTNLDSKFYDNQTIGYMPTVDTSTATNMYHMFWGCLNLYGIAPLDTSNVLNMSEMCRNCGSLIDVPLINASKLTSDSKKSGMFTNCKKLSDTSLDNILQMCIGMTSLISTATKTLQSIGISGVSYPASRIQALPHYQDFINAGWTIGY